MGDPNRLLWIDCLGGLAVGAVVIPLSGLLARWHDLPSTTVFAVGVANVLYGCYSLYVTTRRPRPRRLVVGLAVANVLWGFVCAAIVAFSWGQITATGIAHIGGEGLYVAALGCAEWRLRDALSTRP